jgi:hypothetical protein
MSAARQARLAIPATVAVVMACSPSGSGPQACLSSEDCSADAYCHERVCRADAAPVAAIAAPLALATHIQIAFDGSASADPDPGDAIASYSWSISRVGADCNATTASATGALLETVFTCPGTFRVELVVRDGFGVASAPATMTVSVALTSDPPAVAVGPDLSLDHRCEGAPLLCGLRDALGGSAIQLSAVGSSPVGGSIAYQWTYALPAELAGKPAPRVVFDPSPTVPNPTVLVETDGTAIAGEYRFVVAAIDSRGLVAAETQRVTVGNEPPAISGGTTLTVPHAFTATSRTFSASGATPPLTVTDPDGDPTTPIGFTWNHSGDGANFFAGVDQGDHATFTIAVAYGAPGDAAYLIGAPGLSRTVEYAVVDENGAEGRGVWEVVVDNRPPRVATAVSSVGIPHRFDAPTSHYLASATLSTYVDDDGDPIEPVPGTGDAVCASLSFSGQALKADCALAYAGFPIANQLVGPHPLSVKVRDPWAESALASPLVTIGNRPPRVTSASYVLPVLCAYGAQCCEFDVVLHQCLEYASGYPGTTGSAPAGVADDDGDPVQLTLVGGTCASASASPPICIPAQCPSLDLDLCGKPVSCAPGESGGTVTVTAFDGDLSGSGSISATAGYCI